MAKRESNVDKGIAKICLDRGAYRRKTNGNEFVKDLPDNIIWYNGRVVCLESKLPDDKLSPGQRRALISIQKTGNIAEVCYDPTLLTRILDAIDAGHTWKNGDYELNERQ